MAVAFDPPEGAHEYVYGVVPPVAVTVALPVLAPLHKTSVKDEMEVLIPDEFATVTAAFTLHPFESKTVTVYVPALILLIVAVVPPVGLHKYV